MTLISDSSLVMLQSASQKFVTGVNSVPELPDYERIWTIAEAAKATGYHPEHLRELCRDKKIVSTQVGRTWLIDADKLEQFIKDHSDDARFGPKN